MTTTTTHWAPPAHARVAFDPEHPSCVWVVVDGERWWFNDSMAGGRRCWRKHSGNSSSWPNTPERVAMWAALALNPTEGCKVLPSG